MDQEGSISLPPAERPYSPPGLIAEQNSIAVTRNSITYESCDHESHDHDVQNSGSIVGSHVMSGDLESGGHSQIWNETQIEYWNVERNQVKELATNSNKNISGHHDYNTHTVRPSPHPLTHCQSPPHRKGGEPFNQLSNIPDSTSRSKTEEDRNVKIPETDQSESTLKTGDTAAPPTHLPRETPAITVPKQPAVISTLKRHTYETYSSDDDDVFLPNPPSKSQADKCIVAMATEDGVGVVKPMVTVTVATPEGKNDNLVADDVDTEEPLPQKNMDQFSGE